MKTKQTQTHSQWTYPITVAWSQEDESFIARVPALAHCIGHGDTHEAAVKSAKKMAKLMLASMAAHQMPLPPPTVTTARLAELASLISLNAIARLASIPQSTLASKLKRRTALTVEEGQRLASILLQHGVAV